MNLISIGIDFGTTNSVLAYIGRKGVEVLQLGTNGINLMRSIVSFFKQEPQVNPTKSSNHWMYAVKNCKRCLGVEYSDDIGTNGRVLFNTEVRKREDGKCLFLVKRDKDVQPQEILIEPEKVASYIIKAMLDKLIAKDIISSVDDIGSVSMGIPATFDYDQRSAVRKAAKLAGLENVHFITEPTAAALDYCSNHRDINHEYIVVYDFGGGTFDATLVRVDDNNYEVICTSGDEHLGGSDIDRLLVGGVLDLYSGLHGKDMIDDKDFKASLTVKQRKALSKLHVVCEEAKIYSSGGDDVDIDIECLQDLVISNDNSDDNDDNDDDENQLTITKETLKGIIKPVVNKTFDCINELFNQGEKLTGLKRETFKKFVLVGGSSRLSALSDLIRDKYPWVEVIKDSNPDECVARGACLYAQSMNKYSFDHHFLGGSIKITESSPFSYGVAVQGGRVHHLIKKGDKIPAEKSNVFTTTEDNQEYVCSAVYRGDSTYTRDCELVHKFKFGPITSKPKGEAELNITYAIDATGLLRVKCEEKDYAGRTIELGVQEMDIY